MALSYPAIRLTGAPESLEMALAVLLERGCLGTEEIAEGSLIAYFAEDTETAPIVAEFAPGLATLEVEILPALVQRDWLAEWRASFKGFALGEGFFVLPTWRPAPTIERAVLTLDPEQAFGTGTHDTTRLAAQLLERHLRPGESVIDLGAGTGLLAMVAARLDAAPVTAVEIDPAAAGCARENAARNHLSAAIEVVTSNAEDLESLKCDLLVANITAPVLKRLLPRAEARRLVLSGVLVEELEDFLECLPRKLRPLESWTAGDWAALVLAGPDAP